MSDSGTPTNDITLEQLAARIAQVNEQAERARAEAAALKEQNAELPSRLTRLEGAAHRIRPSPRYRHPTKLRPTMRAVTLRLTAWSRAVGR
jgi:hypothetical protein